MRGNKTNHAKKWMRYEDWQAWLNREWNPFKQNDLPHLIRRVSFTDLKLNFLLGFLGLVLALLAILIVKII